MNISTTIEGKQYYSIMQAYYTYSVNFADTVPLTTFYKKFVKWAKDNNVLPHENIKVYSQSDVESFINEFDLITNYTTNKVITVK